MPDNGILGGLGGLFGGFANALAGSSPAGQEVMMRRQGYNSLAQQMDPGDAALAVANPQLYEAMWRQRLFQAQLREQLGSDPNNPQISYGQALFNIQHPEVQYGLPQYGQPIEGEGGMKVPTGFYHGQPFVGIPGSSNNPQPVGQAAAPQNAGGTNQAQAVPGVGAQAGAPPALQQAQPYFDFFRTQQAQNKAANELATKQADALQQYPSALTTARDAIARLEAHRDNADLPNIVGGTLGVKGRTSALGQGQADLVNESNELQSKIIANTLMATRGVSGRNTNPGTLKELAVGAGDLISARKGTLEGYKQVINNSIDLIKRETQAAWEATGKKGEEPTWGSPSSKAPNDYLTAARAAIAKGAPRDQVILRIKQHGLDPGGL